MRLGVIAVNCVAAVAIFLLLLLLFRCDGLF
jgi:hypothetical protein